MAGGECCRCQEVFNDASDAMRVECSTCRRAMHTDCFIGMANLCKPTQGKKTRHAKQEDGLSDSEKDAILSALNSDCVLVVCQDCQEKADS